MTSPDSTQWIDGKEWRLVPVEPTEAMLYPQPDNAGPGTQIGDMAAECRRQIWARMLLAAQQPGAPTPKD